MSGTKGTGGKGKTEGAADVLVTGIDWLITVDESRRVIRDAAVAIKDGRFAAVGKSADIEAGWRAGTVIAGADRVATPGLIDNHLHSSFQMSRGLADEVNAQAFLFDRMYPFEGIQERDDVLVGASLAAIELLSHGVTCFIDPGNYHPDATVEAVAGAGMRLVVARSTFDRTKSVMGLLPESMIDSAETALAAAEEILDKYASTHDGRVRASASFRGLNNSSDELILGLRGLAEKYDTLLQTHACFSYSTHDGCVASFGVPEIERLEALGVLDERCLLVHSGWLEPHEVAILVDRKPTLVASPSSSMHNGYGNMTVGKLPELMALGVNVSLASDHACSGIVDMPLEMFLAAGGYKEARINPRVMPPEHVLEMATINGARGAGLGDEIGSVEVGKQADLVLFDTGRPEWQPLYNPVSNLVYAAPGNTVATVFVGGRVVVESGHPTLIDEAAVYGEVKKMQKRLAGRLDMEKIVSLKWPVE
ncbi:MAG TPA: amidohydrolase family protein [Rhodospirillales bacterium]|nr:amidohydrolase family protein [Rhodospirillales bacterium]